MTTPLAGDRRPSRDRLHDRSSRRDRDRARARDRDRDRDRARRPSRAGGSARASRARWGAVALATLVVGLVAVPPPAVEAAATTGRAAVGPVAGAPRPGGAPVRLADHPHLDVPGAGVGAAAGFGGAAGVGGAARPAVLEDIARAAGLDRPADREYRLPVPGGGLRARFDAPAERWSAGHRGVDLDAPAGTVVSAPAAGTVVFTGPVVDRHVVTVLHDDGLRSSLEPVAAGVAVGSRVGAGAVLGTVQGAPAATHCALRCLHWGVRDGEAYMDPLDLLAGAGPVVLLPVP